MADPISFAEFQAEQARRNAAQETERTAGVGEPLQPTGSSTVGTTGTPMARFPVGAALGGILGGVLTKNPYAAIPLSTALAGGGEAIQQLVERARGLPVPQTVPAVAQQIGREAIVQGTLPAVGGLALSGAIQRIAAPFAKRVLPEASVAIKTLERGGVPAPQLLPAEATESRILDITHNIAESSFAGGSRIQQFKYDRAATLNTMADDLVNALGAKAGPDDLAEAFLSAAEGKLKAHRVVFKKLYDDFAREVGGTLTQVPVTKSAFDNVLDALERDIRGGTAGERIRIDKSTWMAGTANQTPDYIASPSTFPEYFQNKGYTKAETLNIIAKARSDAPLTAAQRAILDDLMAGASQQMEAEAKSAANWAAARGGTVEEVAPAPRMEWREVGGVMVKTEGLKNFVAPLAKMADELQGIGATQAADDLVQSIGDLKDTMSFRTAQNLRSRLIAAGDVFSIANKRAPAIGVTKHLTGLLDDAMETALNTQRPDMTPVWRQLNADYKAGEQTVNNRFLRALIEKGNPDRGGDPVLLGEAMAKLKSPTAIARIKAVADETTMQNMRSWTAQSIFAKSLDTNGVLNGQALQNNLLGKGELGRPVAEALYGSDTLKGMEDFASALKLTQAKPPTAGGSIAIQLTQGGAFLNLAGLYGTPRAQSAAILLTPVAFSYLFTNPRAARWLTMGLTLPVRPENLQRMTQAMVGIVAALPPRERGQVEQQLSAMTGPTNRLAAIQSGLRPSDVILSQSLFASPTIPSLTSEAALAARFH